jgi:hypothetical protein
MSDLSKDLERSIFLVEQNKALIRENALLRARLRIADLKLERKMDSDMSDAIEAAGIRRIRG